MKRQPITLNGLTSDEVLALPDDLIDSQILCGEPLVFRVGTADILGRFWVADGSLVLELGHIDGGGEGVLPTISELAKRYAQRRGLVALDGRVHALELRTAQPQATSCAGAAWVRGRRCGRHRPLLPSSSAGAIRTRIYGT